MFGIYEFELIKAAEILVREMFKVKRGETFVITADTESDIRVVNTTAQAVFAAEGKPMVILLPSPLGVGKAADPMLPIDALSGALKEADAWIEFNNQWLLYSTPYERAINENKRLRYMCLVGMNAEMMIRVIGRVEYKLLEKFLLKITEITKNAKKMRITTPAGTDVKFENDPDRPISCDTGNASTPGVYMLSGQISWAPKFETINGVIVFDGSVVPPMGLLNEPIKLYIKKGKIVDIKGGKEAVEFSKWLQSFKNPNMLRLAHVCYGFNPGAKLTGNILEDERVWGCTEWGIGYLSPIDAPPNGIPAPSHTDGICLNSSVWLDDIQIMDEGKVIHPELRKLSEKIGRCGKI